MVWGSRRSGRRCKRCLTSRASGPITVRSPPCGYATHAQLLQRVRYALHATEQSPSSPPPIRERAKENTIVFLLRTLSDLGEKGFGRALFSHMQRPSVSVGLLLLLPTQCASSPPDKWLRRRRCGAPPACLKTVKTGQTYSLYEFLVKLHRRPVCRC